MSHSLLDPRDSIEQQNEKLRRIAEVLMRRVERQTHSGSEGYAHFQTAVALEEQVRNRTSALEATLADLAKVNAELTRTKAESERVRNDLSNALETIREGFGLFDADDRLVLRNSRFCRFLPDVVDRLQVGITFEKYIATKSESEALYVEAGATRDDWRKERSEAHSRGDVNFNVELDGDRWYQISEQRSPDGGTAILQTEVTDLVRLERQERAKLLDSQARMIRATLDHLNQGVAIFDAEARLLGVNRALRTMLSPPFQLLRTGTSVKSLTAHFKDAGLFRETSAVNRLMAWIPMRNRPPLALRISSVDMQYYDVFCQETPDGGFVISFTDITRERRAVQAMHSLNETLESRVADRTSELKAARDSAERANDSKSRFIAAVSHDLLQPLNAAKLFLGSLDGIEMDEKPKEVVGRISNALTSVEAILGALLDISRLDTDQPQLNKTDFEMMPILDALEQEFRPVAVAKGLELLVEAEPVMVTSDPTYLRRILQNLLGNAIRYTSAGFVTLRARSVGENLRIEVVDTGRGIPSDAQRDVFKEFTRLGQVPNGEPGMGLGLAIVERACTLLEHPLSFDSTVDVGTVFRIDVPMSPARPLDLPQVPLQRPEPSGRLKGIVALIIENDTEALEAMTGLLESWGTHVISAADTQSALALLDEVDLSPEIIIADYHLDTVETGLDGVGAVRARYGATVPAILVTADAAQAVSEHAHGAGIGVLQKPVEPRKLRSMLVWQISSVMPSDTRNAS